MRLIFLWVGPEGRLGPIPGAFYGDNPPLLSCVEHEVSIALYNEDREGQGSQSSAAQTESGISWQPSPTMALFSDAESQLPLKIHVDTLLGFPFGQTNKLLIPQFPLGLHFCLWALSPFLTPALCPLAHMKLIRFARVLKQPA